jgi:TolB-like protein
VTENTKTRPVIVDLSQFKLHICVKKKIELTLQFNSPSRRFYLSVIAFVVNEMKRQRKLTSIPLEGHHDLLALLNETVGGAAGSSDRGNLLPRIYRKWQHALPDLEGAPLFKVLGKTKEYGGGGGKTYQFTETEKDSWANLFEYRGSEENVRLKFAIDKIGAGLDDVEIIYEDSFNSDAWEKYISSLKENVRSESETESRDVANVVNEASVAQVSGQRKWKMVRFSSSRRTRLIAITAMVMIGVTLVIWELFASYGLHPGLTPKPSIAVLPFLNMSDDPKQAFLADALAGEVINALARLSQIFVIAQSSSFTYKGKAVDVNRVAQEQGVRYVLEGSVQRSGAKLRIMVELFDAASGHQVFSESYERKMQEIFAIQDDITMNIITAMQVHLTEGEQARMTAKGTKNLEAYLKLLEALERHHMFNKENLALARKLLEEAVALDPEYAAAYSTLARVIANSAILGMYEDPQEALQRAMELAQKGVTVDSSLAIPHLALGFLYIMVNKDYEKAIDECERAISLEPGSAEAYTQLATFLFWGCQPEKAIPVFKKALRLSPIPPNRALQNMGMAYRMAGRYEEAIETLEQLTRREPNQLLAHVCLTATYMEAGREDQAFAEAAEVLRIDPNFSAERFIKILPYKNKSELDRYLTALQKAGLK